MNRLRVICLIALVALPVSAGAQEVKARVAGLEENGEYMGMLRLERILQRQVDSISGAIDRVRQSFNADPDNRQKYGRDILRLENEVFDVRDSIGTLTSKLTQIEQDFVLKSLNGGQGARVAYKPDSLQVVNLVENTYFEENLHPQDYQTLLRAQRMESIPPPLIAQFKNSYLRLDSLASAYEQADNRDTAETIYGQFRTLRNTCITLSDSLKSVWGFIYDNKVYNYQYLLDKMNRVNLLTSLERQFQDGSQQIASMRDKVFSETIYAYPIQRRLILSYEQALANLLGLRLAGDSISKLAMQYRDVNYNFARLDIDERTFIEYAPVEFTTTTRYNTANPIPVNETSPRGKVYKVLVGNYQRPQTASVFKGLYPLSYEKLDDGIYRYYAGAYPDRATARNAMETVRQKGFPKAELVMWQDGVYENLSEINEAKFYKVEIVATSDELSQKARQIISAVAGDKEIARVSDPSGKYIFTINNFEHRDAAEKLADSLEYSGIQAQVKAVEF